MNDNNKKRRCKSKVLILYRLPVVNKQVEHGHVGYKFVSEIDLNLFNITYPLKGKISPNNPHK